ncbi:CDGSH iron-sulfur domain-containing protein 3, mitochondrial-like [Hemiscyllium ocellatum]|uniref:CDGSH iron-sulfur domain-containing protein 3, mitochondrial-like n=1 Tax=Hemiscyllium ocellatum TaxID=170820 RepID=UPI002966991C|nr:CDGSH iron-sulfur domain-containing protein 3, mitochondrial-like [Hemiscyllium ocellatum]
MPGLGARSVCLQTLSLQMRSHRYYAANTSKKAVIAAKHPFEAELQAAKLYSWCACGRSKKQPFCDGSHRSISSAPTPLTFKLQEAKKVWLCGCKHSKSPPYCDGTHKESWIQQADLLTSPV